MSSRTTFLALALLGALASCGKKHGDPAPAAPATPTPGSAATPTPGSAATPTPGSAAAPTPGSAATPAGRNYPVAEGAACAKPTKLVTDVPVSIAGATVSLTRPRGGGCPTRPVYTLMYTRANPTEIRVCYDPGADACEMYIEAEAVRFDLTAAFAATGATSAVLGK